MKQKRRLKIAGLENIAQSAGLEKALNRIQGVRAYVNAVSGQATILYKDRPNKWEYILNRIDDFGYVPEEMDLPEMEAATEAVELFSNAKVGLDTLLFSPALDGLQITLCDLIAEKQVSAEQVIYYAASALCTSNCPAAHLFAEVAQANGIPLTFPQRVDTTAADGVSAQIGGQSCKLGSFAFMIRQMEDLTGIGDFGEGVCPVYLTVDGALLGAAVIRAS